MPFKFDIVGKTSEPFEYSYTWKDTALYALQVGGARWTRAAGGSSAAPRAWSWGGMVGGFGGPRWDVYEGDRSGPAECSAGPRYDVGVLGGLRYMAGALEIVVAPRGSVYSTLCFFQN